MQSSDIRARMPPSPSLSILMATTTYFTDVMMISVHTISDSTPSTTSGVGVPLVMVSTVLSVYSGLVPISPKTIPSAARPNAASPDRPTGIVESGCVGMLAFWLISRKGVGARAMLQAQRSIVHDTDRAASARPGLLSAKMLVPLIPASLTKATPDALLGKQLREPR